MSSNRKKPKRQTDSKKVTAAATAQKNFEMQIKNLAGRFNDVQPESIRDALHPFEIAGFCGEKQLSVIQRAITYCIQYLGGSASEVEILSFLHRYWSHIVTGTHYSNSTIPNTRILRINFSAQKEKRFLFVRSIQDYQKWSLNTITAPIETNRRITEQIIPFQNRIVSILRSHEEGLSFDELIELTKQFATTDGSYQHFPHDKRLTICLRIKKAVKEIHFNDKLQKWMHGAHPEEKKKVNENRITNLLKGIDIKQLSADELWAILQNKGIY
jgi:hypothetical protein